MDKQKLIGIAIRLAAIGHDVERKRGVVKRIAEISMEPSMELFRAIDDFNVSNMEFERLESEYITLRNQIEGN